MPLFSMKNKQKNLAFFLKNNALFLKRSKKSGMIKCKPKFK